MKTPITETIVLAANEERRFPLSVSARYVHVRSCTVATFLGAFDSDSLQTFHPGVTYPSKEPFASVRFKDSSGSGCTIEVIYSDAPAPDVSFDSSMLSTVSTTLTAIETLLTTMDADTGAIKTAVEIVDDEVLISNGIETPAAIVALPVDPFLIDSAAAVDKGGGLVGIPVTAQPFATGESVTIANTVNYNDTYAVHATSTANEVVITETYAAETFDGVDDSIVLATPRSIAANAARKELELHNHDGTHALYFGDGNVDPDNNRGIPIMAGNGEILTNEAQIYFATVTAAGKTGLIFSYAEHTRS